MSKILSPSMFRVGLLVLALAITVGFGFLVLQQTVLADDGDGTKAKNACGDESSCVHNHGTIKSGACTGTNSCIDNEDTIGNNACKNSSEIEAEGACN